MHMGHFVISETNESNKEQVLNLEVVDVIKRYGAVEIVCVSFSNLAKTSLVNHTLGN